MGREAFSLEGKHVVVVGASSGLGRATALRCAEAGARISACARRQDRLADLVAGLPGGGHGYRLLDVKESEAVAPVFDGFVADRGPIDGLVYSAGVNIIRPLNVLSPAVLDDVYAVNLRGAAFCCKAATANTRAAREGQSLVLISSLAASRPAGPCMVPYAATKAGLHGLVRAMAIEYARLKVRVNAVAPGPILTELWDSAEMTADRKEEICRAALLGAGGADDVAYACIYCLSSASRWVTGSVLAVDGGAGLGA